MHKRSSFAYLLTVSAAGISTELFRAINPSSKMGGEGADMVFNPLDYTLLINLVPWGRGLDARVAGCRRYAAAPGLG